MFDKLLFRRQGDSSFYINYKCLYSLCHSSISISNVIKKTIYFAFLLGFYGIFTISAIPFITKLFSRKSFDKIIFKDSLKAHFELFRRERPFNTSYTKVNKVVALFIEIAAFTKLLLFYCLLFPAPKVCIQRKYFIFITPCVRSLTFAIEMSYTIE